MPYKDPAKYREYQREYAKRRGPRPAAQKAAAAEWRKQNPESTKKAQKKYYENNKAARHANSRKWANNNRKTANQQARASTFKARYGITLEEKEAMFAAQGFVCKACGSDDPGSSHGWHTDHDHQLGHVRGILCRHCNLGLGNAKDNIETLKKWIAYLEENNG